MTLKKWNKISESVVAKNNWWVYKKDTAELPSGKMGEYHYVYTRGSSMVIPLLNDGRIVLVNQYRYLNDKESLEFPCGGIKDNSTYEITAIEELKEEAGFSAGSMKSIGEFNPYNGVTSEICRIFIAENLKEIQSNPDETEEFERIVLEPKELDFSIKTGKIWDGMTITAWTLAKSVYFTQ